LAKGLTRKYTFWVNPNNLWIKHFGGQGDAACSSGLYVGLRLPAVAQGLINELFVSAVSSREEMHRRFDCAREMILNVAFQLIRNESSV
jgi:hypothetical protein